MCRRSDLVKIGEASPSPKLWSPEYIVVMDSRDVRVPVPDISSEECPVSLHLRLPHLDMLADLAISAARIQKSTGAVAFGSDPMRWPSRWFDFVSIAENENARVENARDKAVKDNSNG